MPKKYALKTNVSHITKQNQKEKKNHFALTYVESPKHWFKHCKNHQH